MPGEEERFGLGGTRFSLARDRMKGRKDAVSIDQKSEKKRMFADVRFTLGQVCLGRFSLGGVGANVICC